MKNKTQNNNEVWLISVTAIFLAVFIFLEIVSKIVFVNLKIIWYFCGLIILPKIKIKFAFLVLAPLVVLPLGVTAVNIWQVIVEYCIAYWVFFPAMFINFKKVTSWTRLWLILFAFALYFLNYAIHVIAGYIWFVNYHLVASIVYNAFYFYKNFLVILPIIFLIGPELIRTKKHFLTYYCHNW